MASKQLAESRKARSGPRASSNPTWEELKSLARSRKLKPLVGELAKECVSFINRHNLVLGWLRHKITAAEALYREVCKEFIEHMKTIERKWRQIDSRHMFRWEPEFSYLFALRVSNGFLGLA